MLRKCHFGGFEDITTTFLPSTGIGCNASRCNVLLVRYLIVFPLPSDLYFFLALERNEVCTRVTFFLICDFLHKMNV